MKQKDVALILMVMFISAIISFFVSGMIIAPAKDRQQKVEVVEPISADFRSPDSKFFNADAINPTQLIQLGENPNPTPFNSGN